MSRFGGEVVGGASVSRFGGQIVPEAPRRSTPMRMSDRPQNWGSQNEADFQNWYAPLADQNGLDRNPDSPEHHYNYRAAYAAGASPGTDGHWPSEFKDATHPNRYVDGVDTITGERRPQAIDLPQYDPAAAANERNREHPFLSDVIGAPGRVAAQLPANIVGLFAPDTALKMKQNVDAYYGTPQSKTAQVYGDVVGGAATTIASLPLGPVGMGAAYGAAGAGDVRTDIAQRRANGEDISGTKELFAAGGTGLIEGLSGYVGGKLFGSIGKALPGIRGLIAKEGGAVATEAVKKLLRVAGMSAAEGGEEALTQMADNIVKKLTYSPDQEITEGAAESGLIGAGLAPIIGGVAGHGHTNTDVGPEQAQIKAQEIADQGGPGKTEVTVEGQKAVAEQPAQPDSSPQRKTITKEEVKKMAGEGVDQEALDQLLADEPHVEVTVTPEDFADIPRQNIKKDKIEKYAAMDEKTSPPILAAANKDGTLRIADGRHRLLAAAVRAKQAGQNPNTAGVQAVVPVSWANARAQQQAGQQNTQPGTQGPTNPVNLPSQVTLATSATPPVRQRTGLQAIGRAFENSAANRPASYVKQRDRLSGTKNLARMDVVRESVKPLEQVAKSEKIDLDDRAVQWQVSEALRGHTSSNSLPTPIQKWVSEQRSSIDAVEADVETEARALGMDEFADSVRARMGTYLSVSPIKRAGATLPASSSRERLNSEVGHFRRDRYVLTDGNGKVVGEAQNLTDANAKKAAHVAAHTGKAAFVDIHEPIPESWRMANEIHDPRHLIGRTMVEGIHLREMLKLIKESLPHSVTPAKGLKPDQEVEWAKQNGLGKVVNDRRLGPISDKYLPIRMAEDFNQAVRMPSEVERIWLTFNSAWKVAKTAFNLPTSGHNIASNALVFSYLDGVSPLNPMNWGFYRKAANAAYNKNHPVWRQMAEANFVGTGGHYAGELQGIFHDAANYDTYLRNSLLRGAKKGIAGVQEFYGAQDDIFKMAAVLKRMDSGMTFDKALAETRELWPDPSRASKIAKWLSNSPLGSSFIRFTDQALRVGGRAAKKHPVRFATVAAMPIMLNALSHAWLGLRDKDPEMKILDEGRSYAEPLLPWRDPSGRLQTFDMRYIIPLVNDILPEQRHGMLTLPLIGNTPAATALLEQGSGRDRFTGRAFVNDEMGYGENIWARTKQVGKTMGPVPSMLTYGVKDVKDAATGQSERVLSNAILNQLTGVNIRTPYVAEKVVSKIARNMVITGDVDQAETLLDVWNSKYKPGNLEDIGLKSVATGVRQSISRQMTSAIEKAAEALMQGDKAEAQSIVKKYNASRESDLGEIDMSDAEAEAEKMKLRGRRR